MAKEPSTPEPASNGHANGSAMKGLPPELITKLMAGGRARNAYGPKLVTFVNDSDEAGINVREVWAIEFQGKEASTLYQGFLSAAKKADPPLTDIITVIKREDDVFLLHKERANAIAVEASA